jgi:hypothetical protein
MSPRYLASTWCQDELEWFKRQVQGREREHGRVFIVRALRTDENRWPEFLRDTRGHPMPGFQYHDKQDSMPYGWRGSAEHREAYVCELWRLKPPTATKALVSCDNLAQAQQCPTKVSMAYPKATENSAEFRASMLVLCNNARSSSNHCKKLIRTNRVIMTRTFG